MRDVLPMEGGYAVLYPAVPESEPIAFASWRMLKIPKDRGVGHRRQRIRNGYTDSKYSTKVLDCQGGAVDLPVSQGNGNLIVS